MSDGTRVKLPLTQQHMADALGLSLVHTNKTLKVLSARGLVEWSEGYLRILNRGALTELSLYERDSKRRLPLM